MAAAEGKAVSPIQRLEDEDYRGFFRFSINVNFDNKMGYNDLSNDSIKEFLCWCIRYSHSKKKNLNHIVFQVEPFQLKGKQNIIIVVKIFGSTNKERSNLYMQWYAASHVNTWDKIACQEIIPNVKTHPCSVGDDSRRIFYNIDGNFFHYLLALNGLGMLNSKDGSKDITEEEHINFFRICQIIFTTPPINTVSEKIGRRYQTRDIKDDEHNNILFSFVHNVDVPFFHIKASSRRKKQLNINTRVPLNTTDNIDIGLLNEFLRDLGVGKEDSSVSSPDSSSGKEDSSVSSLDSQ